MRRRFDADVPGMVSVHDVKDWPEWVDRLVIAMAWWIFPLSRLDVARGS
jgi:hypothetical protein